METKSEYEKVMNEPSYKILNKSCFKISIKAKKILEGITTNDLNKDITAFLDRFGRLLILADQKLTDNFVYYAVEERYKEEFKEKLNPLLKFVNEQLEEVKSKVVHVIGNVGVGGIKFVKNIGYLTLIDDLKILNGFIEISDEVYNMIRIENNIPLQGIDFDKVMFLETGLENAVSFTKGCYVGQEVIAKVHNLTKPVRKLVRILYDKIPEKVTVNGKEVGSITSKCFSFKYNKYLVFALISDYDKEIDNGEILKTF